jgi:hypothetical protein
VFTKAGVEELIKLQPDGRHVKPFQVKQVRAILVKYKLVEQHSGKVPSNHRLVG